MAYLLPNRAELTITIYVYGNNAKLEIYIV